MLWWVLVGCGGDPFEAMLEAATPGDVSAWGVAIGDRDRFDNKRQVGWQATDRALPHLRLQTYNDMRTTYVRGIDLVLPAPANVEALRAAWGPPAEVGAHDQRPGRDPNNGNEIWVDAEATVESWYTADGTAVATLWTPPEADWEPRVTVRSHVSVATALAGASNCTLFGFTRKDKGVREHSGVDNINGGRFRAPSVNPVDLDPLMAIDDPMRFSRAMAMDWQIRDDGTVEAAAVAALGSLEVLGSQRWACGDDGAIAVFADGPRTVHVTIGPREEPKPPESTLTPDEQQVMAAASRQSLTMQCISTESGALRLQLSVKDGKIHRFQVFDVPTSFNNAAPRSLVRTDALARCIADEAKTWRFPDELVVDDLDLMFATRPM